MHQAENPELWYNCEFCTRRFRSGRQRSEPYHLCRNCIEIKRLIRSWVRDGVWVDEAQEPEKEE
mgnify:CR=1 FL=1